MAEEICFNHKGEKIRLLSRPISAGLATFFAGPSSFLHLIKDGKLKIFRHYRRIGGVGIPSILIGLCFLQKGNEKLFR
jgi:hypothetical protein